MIQRISKRTQVHGAVWGVCLALTGCFNSDLSPVPPTPVVISPLVAVTPDASQSIAGLFAYQAAVNATAQADQDKAEPIDISSLTLPTSETAEPSSV